MEVLLRIEIDEAQADAFNASLFQPELDDPVQGDGRTLVLDIIRDSGIDELLGGGGLQAAIQSVTATLDGEPLDYRAHAESWAGEVSS